MQLWQVFATFGNQQTNTGYIFEFILGINAAINLKFPWFYLELATLIFGNDLESDCKRQMGMMLRVLHKTVKFQREWQL